MSESSNDSFPTALHVAAARGTRDELMPALATLTDARVAKAKAGDHIVKIGGNHPQDATPLTLGQEFSGYAAQLVSCRARIEGALDGNLRKLAIGGTAGGTRLKSAQGRA